MVIHYFDTDMAKAVGMQSAVIFENIKNWVINNEYNDRHYHNGRYWTYNTIDAFSKQFYYLTYNQIRYALENLVSKGFLLKGNFNESSYNRTTWYALSDSAIEMLLKSKLDLGNFPNEKGKNPKSDKYINTYINNIEKDISTLHSDISSEKKISTRFKKPTIEEIREYIKEQGYSVDPEGFYDYYEANGWKVGKNPVKDWKACVRTFQRNEDKYNSGRARTKFSFGNTNLDPDREFVLE